MKLRVEFLKASKKIASEKSGFSLIELLMVTVMIGILSSLAILNAMSAKIAANETSAAATLKTFLHANYTYYTAHNSFAIPQQLAEQGFVSSEFGNMETLSCGKTVFKKSGYAFIMVPTKLERQITRQSSSPSSNGNGNNNGNGNGNNNGGGNNSSDSDVVILEYLMDAIPITEYVPSVSKTGLKWFYTDSITNLIWVINDPKRQNPCSPGEFCFDLQKMQPKYDECTPLN